MRILLALTLAALAAACTSHVSSAPVAQPGTHPQGIATSPGVHTQGIATSPGQR